MDVGDVEVVVDALARHMKIRVEYVEDTCTKG